MYHPDSWTSYVQYGDLVRELTLWFSAVSSYIPLTLKQQLVSVYRRHSQGQDGITDVQKKCTQLQQEIMDCELFAVAKAVMASHVDPTDTWHHQNLIPYKRSDWNVPTYRGK